MTCKYRPGDKVVVREDLEEKRYPYEDTDFSSLAVIDEMMVLKGKEVTIEKVRMVHVDRCISYTVREDRGKWLWCAAMLEEPPLAKEMLSCDFGCLM